MRELAIDAVEPRADQPRKAFDAEALAALSKSIQADGLLQPISVRALAGAGDRFEIVAGERRWRASKLAGLATIGAVVLSADGLRCDELALIENLQREDLGPLEKAQAFDRLTREHGLSHAQIAERVGLQRPTVSNFIRLLELGPELSGAVDDGRLTMGHARALLAVSDDVTRAGLGASALAEGWSVRRLEEEARRQRRAHEAGAAASGAKTPPGGDPAGAAKRARLDALAQQVSEQIGARVSIREARKKGAGSVTIEFFSLDEFDALMSRLGVRLDG
ncbi:MAG: ParB/RepB/Spo0J family partition protein [Planctomycetota bacterium]